MDVPNAVVVIFIVFIITILLFMIRSIRAGKTELLHRIYYWVIVIMVVWLTMILGLHFITPADTTLIYVFDCLMYVGTFTPVAMLLIVIAFTQNLDHIPPAYYLLFIIPVLSNIMVWTNPWHHLFYEHFSLDISEIEFGPYMPVSSIYTILIAAVSILLLLRFALKNRSRLCIIQSTLFSIGIAVPLVSNLLATLNVFSNAILVTPLSFVIAVIFHGFAIYRYHFFDLRPVALQSVLDGMSDGYLVISNDGLIISYNKSFHAVFGKKHGITENVHLRDCLKDEDIENKTGLYNLVTAVESCARAKSSISYEQSVHISGPDGVKKQYYIVEVTPLTVQNTVEGFVVYFKDVTTVKDSMERLQASQTRMLEQERLASLGQLVAGLAHNLKTPIMSISGSTMAFENLIEECRLSISDPEVTEEDFVEIYNEMSSWITRMREACIYMSDIITAVKGQAKNMETSVESEFSFDDLIKMVALLLRHELLSSRCELTIENNVAEPFCFIGDINNLVQVLNNLVTNAIDAVKTVDDKTITIAARKKDDTLQLCVRDRGTGIPPDIKRRLFKQMVTGKGTAGTGLGIYISDAIIRAKFDGKMWVTDGPGGGSEFWIALPFEKIKFSGERNRSLT